LRKKEAPRSARRFYHNSARAEPLTSISQSKDAAEFFEGWGAVDKLIVDFFYYMNYNSYYEKY